MNHTVHFGHSNVNNCVDKTFLGSLLFLFVQHSSGNNMSSVEQKLSVKSLGEKCQALRDLEKTPIQRGLKTNQGILLH